MFAKNIAIKFPKKNIILNVGSQENKTLLFLKFPLKLLVTMTLIFIQV